LSDDPESIEARIVRYRQEADAAAEFAEKCKLLSIQKRWLKLADALRKLADDLSKIRAEFQTETVPPGAATWRDAKS
jgi:hypothetical protein